VSGWHFDGAADALARVEVPEGRAGLTNPQLIALAQAHATLALAEEQRRANEIAVLGLGASALDHMDEKKASTDVTRRRVVRANLLRERIRKGLGL
jgi:hypothetical protein